MLVVVRCPACRRPSRVEKLSLGQVVLCPYCQETFPAVEEAETPASSSSPASFTSSAPPASFTSSAPPASSSFRPLVEPTPAAASPVEYRARSEPDLLPAATEADLVLVATEGDPTADAPTDPTDGTEPPPDAAPPVSVLIGLALLPFLIPILWLVGPVLFGESPVLSVATPLALAVSASVLCLAVIGTIDWTPATRVKGVLILVGLSYLTGLGLYFLKKEMVEQLKRHFGTEYDWAEYRPPGAGFQVRFPRDRQLLPNHQPLGLAVLTCWGGQHRDALGQVYTVVAAAGKPDGNPGNPVPGSDAWFDQAARDIANRAGGQLRASEPVTQQDAFPGRELEIQLGDSGITRVVRLFVVRGRVYYLSVEGPGLHPDDDLAQELFGSFLVLEVG